MSQVSLMASLEAQSLIKQVSMKPTKRQLKLEARSATKTGTGTQGPASIIHRTSDAVRSIRVVDERPTQLLSPHKVPTSLEQEVNDLSSSASASAPIISEDDGYKTQNEQMNEQTQVSIAINYQTMTFIHAGCGT